MSESNWLASSFLGVETSGCVVFAAGTPDRPRPLTGPALEELGLAVVAAAVSQIEDADAASLCA